MSNSPTLSYASLLSLAIPAMASSLLNNTYRIIDQYSVKWLGTEAQAAIGSSTFILIAAYSLFFIISGGVGPLISRATGAGKTTEKQILIGQSLIAIIGTAIIFCLVLICCNSWISSWLGIYGNAASEMETYLFWLGLTGFFIAFGPLIDAIYINVGNTKFPMILQLISTILNGILNWFLIYKLNLGIAGAAIASGCSRAVVSIIGIYYLYKDFTPTYTIDKNLKRIIKIGMPMSFGIVSYAVVYWAILNTSLSPLGPHVNAALGIGFSVLEGFSWPLYAGIMVSVSSLIGRQLGAKDLKGTDQTIKLALTISTTVGILITIAFYLFTEPVCKLFTMDPQALQQAILYGHILALSQIFVAWEALFEGILGGAGDTKTVFWISMPLNAIRIPLSYFLAVELGWEAVGIWWAINISTYAKTIVKGFYVWKGKWKLLEP